MEYDPPVPAIPLFKTIIVLLNLYLHRYTSVATAAWL